MDVTDPGRGARWDATWRMILRQEANVSAAIGLLMLVIWALHSDSSFWPRWVWFGLAIPLGLQLAIRRGLGAPRGQRLLTVHSAVTGVLALMMLAIWVLGGARGFFWPVWPALGLGIPLALHGWIRHGLPTDRERALIDRVEVLTRTRSGALDVQAAELRRIERDLHDGAQARMVSVAMNLGLAEELLDKDPQSLAELLAESRSSMLTALDELRTVMRGIQPPVLADRGLEGAVRALALHLAVPVTVASQIPGQAPPPVESAVYFAVSECLANVVKHSGARSAEVELGYRDGVLSVVVSDDGGGGASMTAGTGLRGVARRLEVFDGTIALTSPEGGPTVVRMEVPCELSSPRI
jgi:signal transduction histidine kinase